MSLRDIKKELVTYIENSNDEDLLYLLKEDFIFYDKTKGKDITDELSEQQLEELKELAEEDDTKDTHTPDEFKKATDKWRIK